MSIFEAEPNSFLFWTYLAIIPIFTLINGLITALTLGILSLDMTRLQTLITTGTPSQQKAAKSVLPFRKDPHFLLATLLLGQCIINESLPVALNAVVNNEWISIAVSVALVLSFAELFPQALCTHYGLQISGYFSWFIYALYIFYPIAYPIGKFLDWLLGDTEGALYKKTELKEFVTLHGKEHGGDLSGDEVKIVQGALSLHTKRIDQVMTILPYVFMLEARTRLTDDTLESIMNTGHSRIPVYVEIKDNIIGIILVKNLVYLLLERAPEISNIQVRELDMIKAPHMKTDMSLFDAINFFQEGASHMAIVENAEGHTIGIVTLEDLIEEILVEEILDESDIFINNTQTKKVIRKPRSERKQYLTASEVAIVIP